MRSWRRPLNLCWMEEQNEIASMGQVPQNEACPDWANADPDCANTEIDDCWRIFLHFLGRGNPWSRQRMKNESGIRRTRTPAILFHRSKLENTWHLHQKPAIYKNDPNTYQTNDADDSIIYQTNGAIFSYINRSSLVDGPSDLICWQHDVCCSWLQEIHPSLLVFIKQEWCASSSSSSREAWLQPHCLRKDCLKTSPLFRDGAI